MKIMLLVLLKLEMVLSKVTEPSIFHKNSLIHMSFRRTVKLISSKYNQVKIWQIYSPSPYQLKDLIKW